MCAPKSKHSLLCYKHKESNQTYHQSLAHTFSLKFGEESKTKSNLSLE